MALMRASDNNTVGSAAFEEKKAFYAQSPYALTSEIADYLQWTVQAIAERQKHSAQVALQAWPVS